MDFIPPFFVIVGRLLLGFGCLGRVGCSCACSAGFSSGFTVITFIGEVCCRRLPTNMKLGFVLSTADVDFTALVSQILCVIIAAFSSAFRVLLFLFVSSFGFVTSLFSVCPIC